MHTHKLPGADALRGLLALSVFGLHCWMIFVGPSDGPGFTETHQAVTIAARLGVVCFFVLSGFVIAASIAANRQRQGGRFDGLDFALSRWFRIVPPLALTVVVTWLLYVVLLYSDLFHVPMPGAERIVYHSRPMVQWEAIATLTVTGDLIGQGFNGPLWSLIYEIRLYVFAGLLALLAGRRWWALPLLAAYFYGIGALKVYPAIEYVPRQWAMFAAFGIGAGAYALRSIGGRTLAAGAVALAGLLVASCMPLEVAANVSRHMDDLPWLGMQLVVAALFAVLLIAASRTTWLDRLAPLAGGSYTLYILHFPVLLAMHFTAYHLARPLIVEWAPWSAAAAGVVTFAVCTALGRWVERPKAQRAWVAAWVARRRGAPAPTVTASAS